MNKAGDSHGGRVASQLKSEDEILRLLTPLYRDIGGNPDELAKVTPSYGGWLNALRFCVHRLDGATTWVTRKDIEDANRRHLTAALRSFTLAPDPGCVSEMRKA